MWELLSLLVATALVNNFVLVQFLGLCPFMGTSKRIDTAIPMGLATAFVMTISTLITHSIYHLLLVPMQTTYLKIVVFIVVIASVVQLTELFVRHTNRLLHQLLGIYLPLITSNCAVLGVALLALDLSLVKALTFSIGASFGFALVLVLFSGMQEKLFHDRIPLPLRGVPIALITVGFMALAFSGLRGLV